MDDPHDRFGIPRSGYEIFNPLDDEIKGRIKTSDHTPPPLLRDVMGVVQEGEDPEMAEARQHEKSRLDTVAEMLALTGMLTCRGVLDRRGRVSVTKAERQRNEGSKKDGTQAAHCIPGNVKVDDHSVQTHVSDISWGNKDIGKSLLQCGFNSVRLVDRLNKLVERTEIVPDLLNQSDSFAEGPDDKDFSNGLRLALQDGVNSMVAHDYKNPNDPLMNSVLLQLPLAFTNIYRPSAKKYVREKITAMQNESAGSKDAAVRAMLNAKIRLTGCFLEVLDSKYDPAVLNQQGFQLLWDSVKYTPR